MNNESFEAHPASEEGGADGAFKEGLRLIEEGGPEGLQAAFDAYRAKEGRDPSEVELTDWVLMRAGTSMDDARNLQDPEWAQVAELIADFAAEKKLNA